ncbi:MAG: ABC transporter permease [Thermacetogeniaceae bacterium]
MESIYALWYRDVLRFWRDRARLLGSFAMPFMFLIIFGSGMSGAMKSLISGPGASSALSGFNYVQFMFPGIIGMTILTTSIFSALSVVQDREFGYLREILVSPASRFSVAIGKVLGGSTVAFIQGLLMFVFVPFIGIRLNLTMLVELIPVMFLVAFTLSSVGLLIASSIKTSAGFQMVVQVLVFPMLFLSGALFPLAGMPLWMNFLVKINPLTYAVDMFKKIILKVSTMNPALKQALGLNLTVFNHTVTIWNELLFIALLALVFITLATVSFGRVE